MNSIGASILTLLIAWVLFAPRRWALLGMMAGVLYLTQQQAIDVFGLNLTAIRFLELAAFIRVVVRKEFLFSEFNAIDRALLLLYGYTTLVFLARSNVGQANIIGSMVDAILCYFTFRALIKDIEDWKWFLRALVVILVPYVALLSIEMLRGENPFALLGSWNSWVELRDDRIRAMGSFRNPSILGTLGASLLPLYIGLVLTRDNGIRAFVGIALCLAIVFLSNSGGPLSSAALGVVGWLCWIVRTKMFVVRRVLVYMFALCALAMKAPIWYLLAKVSVLSGGSGWHRAHLMEMAFRDLGKWWFAGMGLDQTKHWFPYILAITDSADITNNFVAFGLTAGLLAIALLILLLVRAFRRIGQVLKVMRHASPTPSETEYLLWGLGCMLVVHIVTWLGITYFDQFYVVWFMQLAAIASVSDASIEGTVAGRPNLAGRDGDVASLRKARRTKQQVTA